MLVLYQIINVFTTDTWNRVYVLQYSDYRFQIFDSVNISQDAELFAWTPVISDEGVCIMPSLYETDYVIPENL